jgi:hypothetical protein
MTDTIDITYAKEKRALVNNIKRFGLDTSGIIFGGLVRDEIIATHYRDEFINNKLDFSLYWDKDYSPETNGRLIIPNDILSNTVTFAGNTGYEATSATAFSIGVTGATA